MGWEEVGSWLRYLYGIVRMCVPNSPLFQRCKVYDKVPFFNKKVYDTRFSDIRYMCIFSLRDISRMFLNELTAIFV